MYFSIQTFLFYYFIFVISMIKCRKYDLEQECMKLYGEDIPSVLQNFRRTPEYLSILQKEKNEIEERFFSVLRAVSGHHEKKLEERIKKLMNYTDEEDDEESQTATNSSSGSTSLRTNTPPYGQKKRFFRDAPSLRRHLLRRRSRSYRRQEPDTNDTTTTIRPIQLLDRYEKLYSLLTLTERNHMRDIGFEYAGGMIEALIGSLGDDGDDSSKSNSAKSTTKKSASSSSSGASSLDQGVFVTPESFAAHIASTLQGSETDKSLT